MNFYERILVLHAQPAKLVLEIIGAIWGIYFLWQQNLVWAIIFGFGLPLLGTVLVWEKNEEELAKTTLGKIMLMHAHPLNTLFHLMGAIPLIYGVWIHSTLFILLGISAILVGHLWGWDRLK